MQIILIMYEYRRGFEFDFMGKAMLTEDMKRIITNRTENALVEKKQEINGKQLR